MEYPAGFDSATMRNKPICGVLAVAIAAGVSFDVAFAACKRNMPAHRQRMRGSTYQPQRDQALKELGVKFHIFGKLEVEHLSVMEFCRKAEGNGLTYLLEIRGHIMTLKDGRLIDQHINKPWREYHHRQIKLKRVVRIDGKGW